MAASTTIKVPVEVVLVTPRKSFAEGLTESVLFLLVWSLIGGLALMGLAPQAAEAFDTNRQPQPGIWLCFGVVLNARLVLASVAGRVRPAASKA